MSKERSTEREKLGEKLDLARLEASYLSKLMKDAEIILQAFRTYNGQASVRDLVGFIEVGRNKDVIEQLPEHPLFVFDNKRYLSFVMLNIWHTDSENGIEEKTTTPYPQVELLDSKERMQALEKWHFNRIFEVKSPRKFLIYQRKIARKHARQVIEARKAFEKSGAKIVQAPWWYKGSK